MKKNIIFALFCWLSAAAFATNDDAKLTEANAKYAAEDFETAVNMYEEILQNGESAAIYYNLGNAYYKSGKLGPAILNYERALLRDPANEDIQYNLELAKSQTVDKIEPIGRFFLLKWIESLQSWFNTNTWAYLSIAFFILTLLLAALFVFARVSWLKKSAFFVGILFFIISIIAFDAAKDMKNELTSHNYAIIFSPTVTVKSSPDESGTELFVVHEGTKVTIKRTLGNWIEIQLEDGNVGWILSSAAERI